jgi:hypothetical protein
VGIEEIGGNKELKGSRGYSTMLMRNERRRRRRRRLEVGEGVIYTQATT